jgi:hypothetical protein
MLRGRREALCEAELAFGRDVDWKVLILDDNRVCAAQPSPKELKPNQFLR